MAAVESQNGRIVVEHPSPGDRISDVVEVNGLSDTYEATVVIRVKDADGTVMAEGTAAGGMMGMKPFSGRVVLERRSTSSEGTIEVEELGGKDSAAVERVSVPVQFK